MAKYLSRLANPRILPIVILEVALLFSIFRVFFLTNYPVVFVDEPWYSNAIWNDIHTGQLLDTMHEVDEYPNPYANSGKWPRLGTLPYRLSFQIFGLGLWQGRIVSWAFGLLQFGVLFGLGSLLFNPTVGALAVLFLAIDPTFVENVVLIRPESFLSFVILLSFFLYQQADKRGFQSGFFLSGLLMALTLDIHPNGALFAIALSLTHLILTGRNTFRCKSTWLFAAGAGVGAVYYILVHPHNILPGTSGIETWLFRPPLFEWNLAALLGSFLLEIGRFRFDQFGFNLAIIIPACVFSVLQKKRENRFLILILIITFVEFGLFSRHKGFHYAGLFLPYLFLIAANSLVELIQLRVSLGLKSFLLTLTIVFIFQNMLLSGSALMEGRGYDYAALSNRLRQAIPSQSSVLAQPVWWLGLSQYHFTSSLNLTYLHYYHQLGLTEAITAIRPDYIVVDDGQRLMLSEADYFELQPGFDLYLLPKLEFEAFIRDRCTLQAKITDPWHGEIEIYRVLWPD